jgi:hypothetical protein
LWPYAIMNVCNCLNNTSSKHGEKSRIELFTRSNVRPNLNHHHHVGIPVYVLHKQLQQGQKIQK